MLRQLYICKHKVEGGRIQLQYSLTIKEDFSWELFICEECLRSPHPLHTLLPEISTVKKMEELLVFIDNSTICTGNPDNKFCHLISKRGGKFMDATGKLIQAFPFLQCMHNYEL